MSALLNLDGRPQTWAELHERNRAYWARYGQDEKPKVQVRIRSSECIHGRHPKCSGRMRTMNHYGRCGCECHEAADGSGARRLAQDQDDMERDVVPY